MTKRERQVLKAVVNALDDALGDSDITHLESDAEMREEVPVQWACMKLNMLLQASHHKD